MYPTKSDTAPGNVIGAGANNANIFVSSYATGGAPYLTDVGALSGSGSAYGTYDQGGDVMQWNDAVISGSNRGLRGGSWDSGAFYLQSSFIGDASPTSENSTFGFRVASVPEPTTTVLMLLSGGAFLVWKRRRVTL